MHIGNFIEIKAKEKGRSAEWLANKIHCKRRNVYDIYKRTTMDTAQLMIISKALETNLFEFFCEMYEGKKVKS